MACPPINPQSLYWLRELFPERIQFPGNEGIILPSGATFERPSAPCEGTIRYNTDLLAFEGYRNGAWLQFPLGSVAGESNTMSNVGTGVGVFRAKVGVDFEMKTLVEGPNITITDGPNEITIEASTAGEVNTASNIGIGSGDVFAQKVGTDLEFRTLRSNIPGTLSITTSGSEVVFDLTGAPYLSLSGGTMLGNINFSGGTFLRLDPAATAALPAISFSGDPDTGMFQLSPDQFAFSAGGTQVFHNELSGVLRLDTPLYETLIGNDNDIPNKKYVDDLIAAIPDHVEVAGDTMTGSLDMTGTAQFLGNASGTAAGPSYAFVGASGTGLFPIGGTSIGISTASVHKWTFSNSGEFLPSAGSTFDIGDTITSVRSVYTDRVLAGAGTSVSPSYSFNAATGTGMHLSGSNLAFTVSGNDYWIIDTTGVLRPALNSAYDIGNSGSKVREVFTSRINIDQGSAAVPSFHFNLDGDTGVWSSGANNIDFTTQGVNRLKIEPDGTIKAQTPSYETLVLVDNDIPNKKYVDDAISATVVSQLDDLSDVTISGPIVTDSILQYNGAQWVNVKNAKRIVDADDNTFVNVDFSGSDSNQIRVQTGANAGSDAGAIEIYSGPAVTNGNRGGDISIISGDSRDTKGSDVLIKAGEGVDIALGGDGGDVNIQGGDGSGSATYKGGDVVLTAGAGVGSDSTGGDVKLVAGAGQGGSNSGGDVVIEAGNHNATSFGSVIMTPGIPTGGGITGPVVLRSKSLSTKAVPLRFEEAAGGTYIGLKAPDSVSISRTWVLPDDDPAIVAGQFLTTDASGNLSFSPGTASSSHRQSFTQASLVGNVLSVNHGLGEKYCQVTVYSNLDRIILPDFVTAVDANNLDVDLTSFVTLSGTWNIVVTK